MIVELTVTDLGVIDRVSLPLPAGMIALTGETGAGKTLLVDALNLLVGGRADPGLVRPGADEAVVDGRFELAGKEYVLSRVVPADGRSRAYINGRPVTATTLADLGAKLVDLHGQHSHQSLLGVEAQRAALDTFGQIDLSPLRHARSALAEIDDALAELGGDERARVRELDLVRYQVEELTSAELHDPHEDDRLAEAQELLSNAAANQESAQLALSRLGGDDGARDEVASVLTHLDGHAVFDEPARRLRDVVAELDDIIDGIRELGDGIEQDPEALEEVLARRRHLRDLCRKYGDSPAEVMAERDRLLMRLKELEDHDAIAAELDHRRRQALEQLTRAAAEVKAARAEAAPRLAAAIESHLPDLAMAKARVGITVEGDDGADVAFTLAANPGSPLQSLAKVASGGELARAMLALRSVLSEAPPILVFDEVDAGIGGQAGLAVGKALGALGHRHQVLVVTHLPQVAAFADAHLVVEKRQHDDATVSELSIVEGEDRLVELARMLSGRPDSASARRHAEELLDQARATRAG